MGTINIIQFDLKARRQLYDFVDFADEVYQQDPNWIPRLHLEYLGNRLLGQVGMFQEEFPFHQTARTAFFLAYRDKKIVGRISATIDHEFNRYQKRQAGAFGFFECLQDQEAAQQLLEAAESWCRQNGALEFIGPLNFSTNHTCGLLIKGHDSPPIIEMTYNPPYYEAMFESYGLRKEQDLISLSIPPTVDAEREARLQKVAAWTQERNGVQIRQVNMKKLQDEVRLFVDLYNETWNNNWGFVPISVHEADHIAKSLELAIEPKLFLFAEIAGKPVAVAGAVPDMNWALRIKPGRRGNDLWRIAKLLLRKKRIHGGRLMLFGVREAYRKKGLESLLFHSCFTAGRQLGYTYGDVGWILENNDLMMRAALNMGATPYKTYRIYKKMAN